MLRRRGRFYVAGKMVRNDEAGLRQLFGKCVIVRCEHLWDRDVFEYLALSPEFDEVPDGEIAPDYTVYGGIDGWKFVRSNTGGKP